MASTTDAFIKLVKKVGEFFNPSDEQNVENSWNMHLKKYGEKSVCKITDDYDENCDMIVFNQATGIMRKYHGHKGARGMTRAMLALVTDSGGDREELVSEISEEDKTVFVAWRDLKSGIMDYTDNVTYNSDFKIIRQYIIYRKDV